VCQDSSRANNTTLPVMSHSPKQDDPSSTRLRTYLVHNHITCLVDDSSEVFVSRRTYRIKHRRWCERVCRKVMHINIWNAVEKVSNVICTCDEEPNTVLKCRVHVMEAYWSLLELS